MIDVIWAELTWETLRKLWNRSDWSIRSDPDSITADWKSMGWCERRAVFSRRHLFHHGLLVVWSRWTHSENAFSVRDPFCFDAMHEELQNTDLICEELAFFSYFMIWLEVARSKSSEVETPMEWMKERKVDVEVCWGFVWGSRLSSPGEVNDNWK